MNEYKKELFAQKTPYLQWLREQETALEGRYGRQPARHDTGKQICTLPFSACTDRLDRYGEFCADTVYLFAGSGGKLSEYAKPAFAEVFLNDTNVLFSYADEDYRGSLKELYGIGDDTFEEEVTAPYRFADTGDCTGACYRGAPWFKPDFSPDTLASFFYIGSVFAVRGSVILEMAAAYGRELSLYELARRVFASALDRRMQGKKDGICHIPWVLYTNDSLQDAERLDGFDAVRARCGHKDPDPGAGRDKVSVVIPSRNNARVLGTCLETLVRYTRYGCYEIIVVDNGSSEEQKMCITRILDAVQREKDDLNIRYLYQESAFNFSAMCNLGARAAEGTYLLFLNDDTEVMGADRDWLGAMVSCAAKAHVGAVGAKLYYPRGSEENGCYRIQHAGIANMGIGPAHKLGGMADTGCLYHGHNICNYNVLAVTAACMLVRKSVFDGAGGFDESFPVAYNDVDFCFRLHQNGYMNVQANEAALLHHESLSRGEDTAPEQQSRLREEMRRLYRKHPSLYAKDPFYSPNLVQWRKDVAYSTGYLYDFDRLAVPVLPGGDREHDRKKRMVLKKYDFRRSVHAVSKVAAKIYDRLTKFDKVLFHIDSVRYGEGIAGDEITDNNITVEGWCAVVNMDNADIARKLWLVSEARSSDDRIVYEFEIAPKLREDVTALLEGGGSAEDTRNTALSGIQVNMDKGALKPGNYRVGVLCGTRLVCDLKQYIHIPRTQDGDTKERCGANGSESE